jgi:predicted peptidase
MKARRDWLTSALAAGASAASVARAVAAPRVTSALPWEQTESFRGTVTKQVALRYLIWMPEPAAQPAGGWPLVIFLHGSGERGRNIAKVKAAGMPKYAAAGRRFPFVLVAPQVDDGDSWHSDEIEALRADLCGRLPIDPDRVLVTGMSMGGYGAWNYAVAYPEQVAAIAPVCGIGNVERAARVVPVPVWAFHGAKDPVVPIAGDREMVDAVREAGGQVKFTVYAGVGHNAWDRAYADPALYAWLLAQRRATSPR